MAPQSRHLCSKQLAQHERQDAAVQVVVDFDRSIYSEQQRHPRGGAICADGLPASRPFAADTSVRPTRSNSSVPSMPSDCHLSVPLNWQGRTPMNTRFERWIRSKLLAMTAFTPRSCVPLAAQSRLEPGAVLFAGEDDGRRASRDVRHRRVVDRHDLRRLRQVTPPSTREPSAFGGSMRFLMRTLAKVPRIMTSWLPRRLP